MDTFKLRSRRPVGAAALCCGAVALAAAFGRQSVGPDAAPYDVIDLGALDGRQEELQTRPPGGSRYRIEGLYHGAWHAGAIPLSGARDSHACVWISGKPRDLGTLGGPRSIALGVSRAGYVVGQAQTAANAWRAFRWRQGRMEDLGANAPSCACAVNSSGDAVGEAAVAGGVSHAILYRNGLLYDLGTLGGVDSSASDINDSGIVVGSSSTAAGDQHAFVVNAGGDGPLRMTDLNSLVRDPRVELMDAHAVAADRAILCHARIDGQLHEVRLRPRRPWLTAVRRAMRVE